MGTATTYLMDKKVNFINRSKFIHDNKYGYQKVDYVNAKTKVLVICPDHGEFEVSPDNHLRKRGCPKCKGKKNTTDDFIQQAKLAHNNRYDYSEVIFLAKSKNVKIICHIHGAFYQIASVHLNGSGCPKCVGKGKSVNEIIEEAKIIHGNKYKYLDFFNKKDSKDKIRSYLTIFCEAHDYKWVATTDSHILKRTGCTLCGDEASRKKQQSDFLELIKRINKIHPNYTIPQNQEYINQNRNINYICSIHGFHRGRPINLLNGQGCPVCGQEKRNEFFRDDWFSLIEKINFKHPKYFIYPEQPFINHHTPIVFKCPIHGDKISNANNLLSKGSGCPECSNIRRSESQKSNWEDVFKQIEEIHKNISIPKEQRYINTNTKIEYTCIKHGKHSASPSKLLRGSGCPQCAHENHHGYLDSAWIALCGKRIAKLYWIEMQHNNEVWYKFGRTFMSVKDRFWELKKKNITYCVVKVISGDPEYICKLERRIHKFYKKYRYIPSVDFGGRTECFKKNQ